MDWGNLFSNIGSGLINLFGGSSSTPSYNSGGWNQSGNSGWSGVSNSGGGLGSLFGGFGRGLAGIGASQLIKNPQYPALPPSFSQLQQTAQAGGPPIQQQSNQYLSTLLSGQNTEANDAATRMLDLQHEEELRQLQGQYKSLRPGSDPLTDSTWLRDKSLLDQKYAQNKADTLARQQMMAAQQGGTLGNQQFEQQAAALQPELEKQYLNYAAQYQKQAQLRNSLMGLFGNYAGTGSYGIGDALSKLFGG